MKKIILLILIVFSTTSLHSQNTSRVPAEEFSIGFEMSGGPARYGPVINYAFNENFHGGAQIGIEYSTDLDPVKNDAQPGTLASFRFYGQYYFDNIRNMRPFVRGNFILSDNNSLGRTVGNGFTGITIEPGGAWFPFNNLGIYGGFSLVGYNFDISAFTIGLGAPFVGIQFYL